uniref:GNAT family N-acetyltransferase n=1 Tax=Algoriphagus sp. TaxID=1872435 RepID=UPI004048D8EC
MEKILIRKAVIEDSLTYFNWVNDPVVREQSYNSENISWIDHEKWFNNKIIDPNFHFYIFLNSKDEKIGQIRLQKIDKENCLIGVSIAAEHRGKGYGSRILKMGCKKFLTQNPSIILNAYIKETNISSLSIFEKAGFYFNNKLYYNNFKSFHYILCK